MNLKFLQNDIKSIAYTYDKKIILKPLFDCWNDESEFYLLTVKDKRITNEKTIPEFEKVVESKDFFDNNKNIYSNNGKTNYFSEDIINNDISFLNDNKYFLENYYQENIFKIYPLFEHYPPFKMNNNYKSKRFPFRFIIIPQDSDFQNIDFLRQLEKVKHYNKLIEIKNKIIEYIQEKFDCNEKNMYIFYKFQLHHASKIVFYCEYLSDYGDKYYENMDTQTHISLNTILFILNNDLMDEYIFSYPIHSLLSYRKDDSMNNLPPPPAKNLTLAEGYAGGSGGPKNNKLEMIDISNNSTVPDWRNTPTVNNHITINNFGYMRYIGDDLYYEYEDQDNNFCKIKYDYESVLNDFKKYINSLILNQNSIKIIRRNKTHNKEKSKETVKKKPIAILENFDKNEYFEEIYLNGNNNFLSFMAISLKRNHIDFKNTAIDKLKECDKVHYYYYTDKNKDKDNGYFYFYLSGLKKELKVNCIENKIKYKERFEKNEKIKFTAWHYLMKDINGIKKENPYDSYFDLFDLNSNNKYYINDIRYEWLSTHILEIVEKIKELIDYKTYENDKKPYFSIYCHVPAAQGFHLHFQIFKNYNDFILFHRDNLENLRNLFFHYNENKNTIEFNRYFNNEFMYYNLNMNDFRKDKDNLEEKKSDSIVNNNSQNAGYNAKKNFVKFKLKYLKNKKYGGSDNIKTTEEWLSLIDKSFITFYYRPKENYVIKKYKNKNDNNEVVKKTDLVLNLLKDNKDKYNCITKLYSDNKYIVKLYQKSKLNIFMQLYFNQFNINNNSNILFYKLEDTDIDYKNIDINKPKKNIKYDLIFYDSYIYLDLDNKERYSKVESSLYKIKSVLIFLYNNLKLLKDNGIICFRLSIQVKQQNLLNDFLILLSTYCTCTVINNELINKINYLSMHFILSDIWNISNFEKDLKSILDLNPFENKYEGFLVMKDKNLKIIDTVKKLYNKKLEKIKYFFELKDFDKNIYEAFMVKTLLQDKILVEDENLNWFIRTLNSKIINIENKKIKLHSSINFEEGTFIKDLILKNKCLNVLEVGMAYGISSIFIITSIYNLYKKSKKKGFLLSIDPNQSTQWKNIGLYHIKKLKLQNFHKFIEKKSYEALPLLIDKYTFDLIFIDGFHTFDYTLIDIFYSIKLLKNNGLLLIDDALHYGVSKAIRYIETNYNFLKRLESPKTFALFKLISEDNRDWNFHKNF